jgi:SAM-dependent methyltransferase
MAAPETAEAPFVPGPEVERHCRELLAAYVPKLVGPDRVEPHIAELLDLTGGFVDRFNYFAPRMPDDAKARLLISGCACGSEMIVARRYGFQEVHGTEVVPELVSICNQRLEGAEGFSASLYDGAQLPYPDHHFTSVVSGHIIEHTPSPRAYLHEHLRVLRPGGWFFLEFPNRFHRRELHTGVPSVEYLPGPLRAGVLRWLSSPLGPCSTAVRQHYEAIRNTLQPISIGKVRRWLRSAKGHPARLVHSYAPAPGYVRMLLYRT